MTAEARSYLRRQKVDQWQDGYPDAAVFEADIEREECYIRLHGDEAAGYFTLSAREEPDYAQISDGKWSSDEPYCVLHRNALAGKYRGTGMSAFMMRCVEELVRECGRRYVRVYTHRKNKPMQKLLRSSGYRYRGNVNVAVGEGHDPARQAYEKKLK